MIDIFYIFFLQLEIYNQDGFQNLSLLTIFLFLLIE